MKIRSRCTVTFALLTTLAACNEGSDGVESAAATTGGGDGPVRCEPGGFGPLPVGETPPAPRAECSDPPSRNSTLFELGLRAQMTADDARRAALNDPGTITVVTCGTGSPVPSGRAQACTAVFVNGQFLLFDAGDGAARSLEVLTLPVTEMDAVFLTHFHSDHIADLGEVMSRSWILGRTAPLPVYGGEAVERVVGGFNAVYALDDVYRVAHHGETVFPNASGRGEANVIEAPGIEGAVVYDVDGVVVKAYGVDHSPISPALAFRVEFGGKSVAISGDTIDTDGLRAAAAAADVLVSEVMNKPLVEDIECAFGRAEDERNATIFADIRSYHVDVEEVAQLAQDAGVGTLVYTHLVPVFGDLSVVFRDPTEAIYSGPVIVAEDGTQVTVPVD